MDAGTSEQSPRRTIKVRCCIVGGGPAGMMLGYLLGRAGVDVVVLEKHADFFRDFRGDTVHPSTLQVMDELGLIDGFLNLPHQLQSRPAMMKTAGHFDRGSLFRAVDAPHRRGRGALPIVGTIPHRVAYQNRRGVLQDFAVEAIRRDFLSRINLEP